RRRPIPYKSHEEQWSERLRGGLDDLATEQLVSNRPGSVQPTKYIPPIYYKYTKYTTGGIFFGGAFWALSGTLLVDYANPTPQIDGGRFDRPIGEYITTLSSAATT
ncbi:hypothetical protein, partial [Halobiforma nitratireducens]|uniref:hypothetical protein n=1 Tax=Halobiforma nitratireducens TaxID=130048 RepID=UPI00195537C4